MTTTERPQAGSRWKYVGGGDGQGVIHTITSAEDLGAITTWSEPTEREIAVKGKIIKIGGYSYQGTIVDFLQKFRPA